MEMRGRDCKSKNEREKERVYDGKRGEELRRDGKNRMWPSSY